MFRDARRAALAATLSLLLASAPAMAEDEKAAVTLESVVVTATRSPEGELGVPASVTVIDREQLDLRDPKRLGDALADVPGLYIRGAAMGSAYPGTGQSVLSLRGIPRTPRTLVMIDGQPVNNALTGGINVAGIPLNGVERVEVVRGPYSALYGGAAMGGVINFLTASPDDALTEVRAGAGNFRQRGGVLIHRQRYEGGLGVSLSASYLESDGDPDNSTDVVKPRVGGGAPTDIPVAGVRPTTDQYGAPRYWVGTQGARPWSQSNAQLSLHYSPSASTKLVAGIGWADYSVGYVWPVSFLRSAAGAPVYSGGVLFDDAGTTRRLSLSQTDWFTATPAGERDQRAFVRAEHRFDGGSELRVQLGTLHHDSWFAQATAGVAQYASGPGNLTEQPNRRIDGDLSLRTSVSSAWTLIGGVSVNHSALDRTLSGLAVWRDTGTTVAALGADGGRSDNAAAFLQSEHYLDHGLTAYVGGRYDRFETRGYAVQNVAPVTDQNYPSRSFGQFSPKVALVWEALRGVSLRASYGAGFRPPSLFDLYGLTVVGVGASTLVYEPSPQLGPERVKAFELGADVVLAGGRRASLSVYRQRLEDLIYRRTLPTSTPVVTRTRAENVAEADVNGFEANARWPTGLAGLTGFGSLTRNLRYEISRNDTNPAMVGKKLTDVPGTMWSAGLEYERGPWTGFIAARYVSHVFASGDDMNRGVVQGVFGSYDRYTVVAARAAYQIDRHWRVGVNVDNLTDRVYFVSNRQPGRTVYAELSYRF